MKLYFYISKRSNNIFNENIMPFTYLSNLIDFLLTNSKMLNNLHYLSNLTPQQSNSTNMSNSKLNQNPKKEIIVQIKIKKILFLFLFNLIILFHTSFAFKVDIVEALMIESLRNNLIQACDGEKVILHCPRNTHILIQTAFYGRLVPSNELCPVNLKLNSTELLTNTNQFDLKIKSILSKNDNNELSSVSESNLTNLIITPTLPLKHLAKRSNKYSYKKYYSLPNFEDTSCDIVDAHTKIIKLCNNKRKCRIVVRPSVFGDRDPCPTTSKYLQISYKCKPISFEDQNFCEGTTMQLSCKSKKRLSIYSAQYGRTVNGQAMRCTNANEQPVSKDCVSDVLPLILRKCHAQTECTIAINDHFLGNPCAIGIQKHLSLIYMCVNNEVFSEAALKGSLETMKEIEEELNLLSAAAKIKTKKQQELKNDTTKTLEKKKVENDLTVVNQINQESLKIEEDYNGQPIDRYDDYNDDIKMVPSLDNNQPKNFKDTLKNQKNSEKIFSTQFNSINTNKKNQLSSNILDSQSEGFPQNFLFFVKHLKQNKEESFLYIFLFTAVGIILLLIVCICYQCHIVKKRSKKNRYNSSLLSNNLLISSAKFEKQHFFRQNHNQTHQTVYLAPSKAVSKFWKKENIKTRGILNSSGSSSATSTNSTRSSGCTSANRHPKILSNNTSENVLKNDESCREHAANGGSDVNSLIGSSAHTTPLYLNSDNIPPTIGSTGSTYTNYWDYYDNNYALNNHNNSNVFKIKQQNDEQIALSLPLSSLSSTTSSHLDKNSFQSNHLFNRPLTGMLNNSNLITSNNLYTSQSLKYNKIEENSDEQNYYSRCGTQSTLQRIPKSLHYYS